MHRRVQFRGTYMTAQTTSGTRAAQPAAAGCNISPFGAECGHMCFTLTVYAHPQDGMRSLTLVALVMAMCVIVRVACRPPPDGSDPTGPDSELDAGPHRHRPRAWISTESKRHPCRACLRCT